MGTRSPRYRQFLKQLRAAREDAGLTQVDVAERIGRPQWFVSKCESGVRGVDIVELEELAAIYDKPIGFLLP